MIMALRKDIVLRLARRRKNSWFFGSGIPPAPVKTNNADLLHWPEREFGDKGRQLVFDAVCQHDIRNTGKRHRRYVGCGAFQLQFTGCTRQMTCHSMDQDIAIVAPVRPSMLRCFEYIDVVHQCPFRHLVFRNAEPGLLAGTGAAPAVSPIGASSVPAPQPETALRRASSLAPTTRRMNIIGERSA